MDIDFNRISIGDRLVRTKGGVLSKHHAIYAGFWNNQHLVAENQLNFGVRYITLNQFLDEGKLDRVEYNDFNESSQAIVIQRINARVGKAYDLIRYNCEHFTNEILRGVTESKQVKTGLLIGLGVSLCLAAFGVVNKK